LLLTLITGSKGTQIKDAVDLKRVMITVVIAMIPALLFGIFNVGHQHFLATGVDAAFLDKVLIGLISVLPILIVSYAVGLSTEFTFCVIRNHPISEGFLVTGMLIALVMPPNVPLWQVALATIFAVVIGKEVFGGTGMNILNVAMTARAFLYFAYPAQISGDQVWTYLGDKTPVDGFSGATALAVAYTAGVDGRTCYKSPIGTQYCHRRWII
jgi:Na+-transporting NADH:ubiquinone oxidoreductase subunit B